MSVFVIFSNIISDDLILKGGKIIDLLEMSIFIVSCEIISDNLILKGGESLTY
jgi:hypothetical protein